ncbi:hypothetical protein [Nostoc sp. DSM 114159]|jgi:hypothetical protein
MNMAFSSSSCFYFHPYPLNQLNKQIQSAYTPCRDLIFWRDRQYSAKGAIAIFLVYLSSTGQVPFR